MIFLLLKNLDKSGATVCLRIYFRRVNMVPFEFLRITNDRILHIFNFLIFNLLLDWPVLKY